MHTAFICRTQCIFAGNLYKCKAATATATAAATVAATVAASSEQLAHLVNFGKTLSI